MPNDRVMDGDPSGDVLAATGVLESPTPGLEPQTLAARLVPVADRLRALKAKFGIRPYRVFLLHGIWESGVVGEGYCRVTSKVEITPPPRVTDMSAVAQVLRSTGMSEEGDVRVTEISARFTEDDLMGKTPDLKDDDVPRTSDVARDFWWEIVENRPQIPRPVVRRYAVNSVPTLSRDGLQWRASLTKQDYDRGREGETVREAE